MRKGSLSVFLAMVLVSVMTLIFAMSECIRLYELHDFGQEFTDMAVESSFSEYNPYLWANYRILAVDLGYGTDVIGPQIFEKKTSDYANYNTNVDSGKNFARLICQNANVDKYALLTDNGGQGIVMLGSKSAKAEMMEQIVDVIKNQSDSINSIEKVDVVQKAEGGDKALADAKAALQEKKNAAANDDDPNTNPDDYGEPGEVEDNPLDAFKIMKEAIANGVLATVVQPNNISEASVNLDEMPSHRTLNKGTMEIDSQNAIVDKALFTDYLLTYYSYYGNDLKHDGLKYEVEYLLTGKETDAQCLAAVVEELLLIREAANYATICKTDLNYQAEEIAAILSSFTGNYAVEKLVKYAIIAAWAYVESVLDLRQLLSGGKVALVKEKSDWTSDVAHLSAYFDVNYKAKPAKAGISYKVYLLGLLMVKSNSKLAMRACDVMENALNTTEDYKGVKVDNMMFAAEVEMDYTGQEMFLSLFNSSDVNGNYEIKKRRTFTY